MTSALEKLPDETLKLTITIPGEMVKKTWDEVVNEALKTISLPGFRKGKAPRKIAEEKLDKENLRDETLKKLLPKAYLEATREHNLKPIINPKIHVDPDLIRIEKLGQDWQFTALTCEAPEVQLDNYKKAVQQITAKEKIIIPGKEPQKVNIEDLIKTLLDKVSLKIPGILKNLETDRLLAQTLDEVKKLGLTLEQYLASTNRTSEDLRREYEEKTERDLKLEFVLQKISEEEKITVSDKEIAETIEKAKTPEERKNLESNRYLLASILRQQKTLDFIKNL